MAIPDSILIYNMQTFLEAYLKRAPKVQLIVNSMPSEEINQAIVDGTADIGINCEKEYYSDSVVCKRLGTYRILLVVSPKMEDKWCDFTTPHQRKPFSMICNEPEGFYQLDMDKYLREKDILLRPYMKVQSIEAVKRCVESNLGIAVVPSYSVERELKEGSLVAVKTDLDEKTYNSFYVYHKNKWRSPR